MRYARFQRALITTTLLLVGTFALGGAQSAQAAGSMFNGCASSGIFCVSSENANTQTLTWTASTGEDISNFATATYGNGTAVDDRVNSIRDRGNNLAYARVCFYRDPGFVVFRSSVARGIGWFDNTSTDISSGRWMPSSC